MKGRRLSRRRAGRAQMCAPRLHPGCGKRCYRDQSQNPLNEDAASRALARPTGLRASFAAAARAFQSSCRSSRQKESLPASLRRELAFRTVFDAFFCGDESANSSLAPARVAALSGVVPWTSALTGASGRALQSSVRSSRQKRSLSMSSRRVMAVRTVFCTFFFGGDELATASLAPGRTPAFSGADAGTSLPAGAAFEACVDSGVSAGGAAAAGASLRPNGSRAIAGLSTAFRIRTMRALGAMAEAGADVSLDVWADTSADACGRAAVAA